jgi:hypothetical protein
MAEKVVMAGERASSGTFDECVINIVVMASSHYVTNSYMGGVIPCGLFPKVPVPRRGRLEKATQLLLQDREERDSSFPPTQSGKHVPSKTPAREKSW